MIHDGTECSCLRYIFWGLLLVQVPEMVDIFYALISVLTQILVEDLFWEAFHVY
jgi:hypothetical protein